MRTLLASILFAATAAAQPATPCADDETSDAPSYCEVREVTVPARDLVRVDGGPSGGITVTTWDLDSVRVQARIRTYGPSVEAARARARTIEVQTDGTIRAADLPGAEGGRWVSLRVTVPRASALDLTTNNGSISVTGVRGQIALASQNGSITLTDVGGDVRGRTANGSLRVAVADRQWQGSGLDLTTANGSVRLTVPDGFDGRIATGTLWGRVTNDTGFPFATTDKRRLELTLGAGGPLLRAVTTSGSVAIVRG